jgi:hypothetical protein
LRPQRTPPRQAEVMMRDSPYGPARGSAPARSCARAANGGLRTPRGRSPTPTHWATRPSVPRPSCSTEEAANRCRMVRHQASKLERKRASEPGRRAPRRCFETEVDVPPPAAHGAPRALVHAPRGATGDPYRALQDSAARPRPWRWSCALLRSPACTTQPWRRLSAASRDEQRAHIAIDQNRSEALTGIIGARRACTVSTISPRSIPCR